MTINERLTILKTKLQARLTSINTSLTEKGQTIADDLSDVPTLIDSIQVNTGSDTADATAYAHHILNGYTAYARGSKVTGTYESLDTSDATANSTDILSTKTAYVNGVKIIGTHVCITNTSDYQTQINTINSIVGG